MAQTSSNSTELAQNSAHSKTQDIIEPKQARWTAERQIVFLSALASSHSVTVAAREAGVSRQSAYRLRARLKGQPFDLAWDAALTCGLDTLVEAALERALNGVEVPHFYKGELIHTSRKFDEKLTIALLSLREKRRPDYVPSTHRAFAFLPDGTGDELPRLLKRVARGPERWDDE